MTETCPSCGADRITDHPDVLAQYVHTEWCALAHAEAETLAEDQARYRRFATHSRHRAATQAERALLAASGVPVPPGECFTRVQWQDGVRTRTWRRQPVVSVTTGVVVSRGGAAGVGGTPSGDLAARTVRQAKDARRDAPAFVFQGAA